MAPRDWVENAREISWSFAWILAPKKVPIVTYQEPQTKNSRNIISESLILTKRGISCEGLGLCCFFGRKI